MNFPTECTSVIHRCRCIRIFINKRYFRSLILNHFSKAKLGYKNNIQSYQILLTFSAIERTIVCVQLAGGGDGDTIFAIRNAHGIVNHRTGFQAFHFVQIVSKITHDIIKAIYQFRTAPIIVGLCEDCNNYLKYFV